MKYVTVPKELSIKEVIKNRYTFAPSKFLDFRPKNFDKFISLDKLVVLSNKKQKILRSEKYFYLEIGDIDTYSGCLNYLENYGYKLPTLNPVKLMKDDLIISTVRTYRKGIGIIDKEYPNIVGTNAFLVIRSLLKNISKEYLLSLLRHDFFIEQILSLQNRGMYPRLERNNLNRVYVPLPRNEKEHELITILQKAYLNKQNEIRKKHNFILSKIENELLKNQKKILFRFAYPNVKELNTSKRMDAGFYGQRYKQKQFLIKNYLHNSKTLEELGYKIKRGQNLQVSCIGQSIYSLDKKDNFYNLIRPTSISEYGTIMEEEYLGNSGNLSNLEPGDIIFSGEGTVGKCILFVNPKEKMITNIHGIILNKKDHDIIRSAFVSCFLRFLRHWGVLDYISVGGQGGSLAMQYWKDVRIADFPPKKQEEIAKLYCNSNLSSPSQDCSLKTFLQNDKNWNEQAGILELDASARRIRKCITCLVDKIIADKKIEADCICI
jgi:type I restriction enzyme S subunit